MLEKFGRWTVEQTKACTDFMLLFLLRRSSRFGAELNDEGRAEQRLWREQRLRNLRGLGMKSPVQGLGRDE